MKRHLLIVACLFASNGLFAQEFGLGVINDTSYVVSGGVDNSGVSRSLAIGSFEYQLNDKYTFYIEGQLQRGKNGSDDVGDIQAYSNIDEDDFSKLYEIWFQGQIDTLNLRFKLGQVDANTEFAFLEHNAEFINSSMGFSPTILFLPTYPSPTLSANLFWRFVSGTELGVGIYSDESNDFDEIFSIVEWRGSFNNVSLKVGIWDQTGDIMRLDNPDIQDGTTGYYLAAEGGLPINWLSASKAGWYSQVGYADDSVGEIDLHLGLGVILYDTFENEGDSAGVGVTHVKISEFLHQELHKNETSVEMFYRYQLNEYIALKPDLQIIFNPSTDKSIADAIVFTLRTEVSF